MWLVAVAPSWSREWLVGEWLVAGGWWASTPRLGPVCPIHTPSLILIPALDNADLHNHTMRLPTLVAGLMALMASNVAATALTYKLTANERACFYAATKNPNEKIAFYFAVCGAPFLLQQLCCTRLIRLLTLSAQSRCNRAVRLMSTTSSRAPAER